MIEPRLCNSAPPCRVSLEKRRLIRKRRTFVQDTVATVHVARPESAPASDCGLGTASAESATYGSPGQRPGFTESLFLALKGRPKALMAHILDRPFRAVHIVSCVPRALPWADIGWPFRPSRSTRAVSRTVLQNVFRQLTSKVRFRRMNQKKDDGNGRRQRPFPSLVIRMPSTD